MSEWLPVAIQGVTDRVKDEGVYILKDDEKERVSAFYEGYGFSDIVIRRVEPAIGPIRDEVRAELPSGWDTRGNGHYWVDYINEEGIKAFSVFWKGVPWDYCTFVRR